MPALTSVICKKLAAQTSSGSAQSVWPPLSLDTQARGSASPAFARQGRRGTHALSDVELLNLDIWAKDIERQPAVFESVMQDGILHRQSVAFCDAA